MFWLCFFLLFLGLWFLRSGVTIWLPVGVAAYVLIFAALSLGRRAAMISWFIETEDEGLTLNLFGASYIRYAELESLDRHGDDITFHFTQPIPLNIIPGLVSRRVILKLKVENAQALESALSRPFTFKDAV